VIRIRGRALRYHAAIRGLDQHRLAQAAGVSQATVSRAMAGHRVHRATMLRLAAALKRQQPIPELQLLLDVDDCEGRGPLPATSTSSTSESNGAK
jgi:transcriptional regulator with XRE-family HTH domain